MKLSSDLLKSLTAYTANLKGDIKIVLQTGVHEKRDELRTFLSDVCSVSKKLYLEDSPKLVEVCPILKNQLDDFVYLYECRK